MSCRRRKADSRMPPISLRGWGHFCVHTAMTTHAHRKENAHGHQTIQLWCGRSATASLPSPANVFTVALFELVCETLDMSVESAPERCPSGHPLTAGVCLVGWEVCGCTENGGHRTHYCRLCGRTVRTPPCVKPMPQVSRWT